MKLSVIAPYLVTRIYVSHAVHNTEFLLTVISANINGSSLLGLLEFGQESIISSSGL